MDIIRGESMVNSLQSLFDAFILEIQRGMVVLISLLSSSIIGDDATFSPNMEAILKVMQPDMMLKLINFFRYAGLVVIIVMIAYSVFIRLFGNVMEIKDGLILTFGRAGVAIMFIFFLVHPVNSITYDGLLDKILVVGNNVYSNAISNFTEEDAMTANTDVLQLVLPKESLDKLGVESDGSMSAEAVELGATASNFTGDVMIQMVVSLFRLVLIIITTYLMIKLIYEIIKHFVNIIGLYAMTPFMASFFVSSNTATITTSFIRMFCSEIIMMAFCRVWVIISLYVMYNYVNGVPGMFVVIGIIQFGISIDNILKNLGFATSNTGGALLDSVSRAGMSLVLQAKEAKQITGGSLIAAGNTLGASEFNKMGSLLKSGTMSPEAVARTQELGVTGALRLRNLASDKSAITPSEIANMKSLFDKGNMNTFTPKYNALSNANKQAVNDAIGKGFSNLSNSLAPGSSFSISGIDGRGNAGYKVQDKNGKVLSEGSISRTKNANALGSIPFTDNSGNQWYANVGEVANTNGKMVMPKDVFQSSPDYKADEAIRTANQMGLKNKNELNKVARNMDYDGTHYLYDSDSGVVYYNGRGEFDGPMRKVGHVDEDGNYIKNVTSSGKRSVTYAEDAEAMNHIIHEEYEALNNSLEAGSSFVIEGKDENGNVRFKVQNEEGDILSEGSISKSRDDDAVGSIPFIDANGNQRYANIEDTAKNEGKNILPKDVFTLSKDYKAETTIRTANQMELKSTNDLDKFIDDGDTNGTHYQFDSNNNNIYYDISGEFDGEEKLLGKIKDGKFIKNRRKNDVQ